MKKVIKGLFLVVFTALVICTVAGCSSGKLEEKLDQWACSHTYGEDPTSVIEATCTKKGEKVYTCTKCGKEKTESIAKLSHDVISEPKKEATCTERGWTEYSYCGDCGVVIQPKTMIPAMGHSEVVGKGIAATCTNYGMTGDIHCATCGEIFVPATVIPAKGHNVVTDAAVTATCGTDGKTAGSHCTSCGEVFRAQQVIPATGNHTFVDAERVEPTCGTVGYEGGKACSVCGIPGEGRVVIPATGNHTIVEVKAVLVTCTTDGRTAGRYCSDCGEVFVASETIPATGHTIVVDESVSATCVTPGKTVGSHCSVCKEIIVAQEEIPALGGSHDYAEDYICKVCGYEYYTEGLAYELSQSGKYYMVTGIGTATDKIIVIPTTYNGIVVKAVDGFSKNKSITGLVIRNSVDFVQDNAFSGCTALEKVYLDIGYSYDHAVAAFSGCTSLKEVILGENFYEFGRSMFQECSALERVIVKGDLKDFGNLTFANFTSVPQNAVVLEIVQDTTPANPTTVVGAFFNTNISRIIVPKGAGDICKGSWTEYVNLIEERAD